MDGKKKESDTIYFDKPKEKKQIDICVFFGILVRQSERKALIMNYFIQRRQGELSKVLLSKNRNQRC